MAYISTMNDSKDLAITIYNNSFGVVKEMREMHIPENETQIQYLDVAQMIETDSIIVKGVHILELNYDYDLVSREKLLQKYIDKTIILFNKEENTKNEYRLLSVIDGMVLEKLDTKEIVINPEGEIILPKLPGELITRPALIWKVKPCKPDKIDVSYITKGLEWNAQYVVNLNQDACDIEGWVDIKNNSGTTYENTRLKLIAGEVNRVRQIAEYDSQSDFRVYNGQLSDNSFEEQEFNDFHMYTLTDKTTLKNNQSKQINFIKINNVPYIKFYEYNSSKIYRNGVVNIIIEFDNKKENNLGIPMPKGVMKVYAEDKNDNSLEFIGEDSIKHTAKDEAIMLNIGEAFDVKCEGRPIDTKKDGEYEYHTFRYEVWNHKNEEILLKINHYMSEPIWEMVECSEEYAKEDYKHLAFLLMVSPDEHKFMEFQYRVNKSITVKKK